MYACPYTSGKKKLELKIFFNILNMKKMISTEAEKEIKGQGTNISVA